MTRRLRLVASGLLACGCSGANREGPAEAARDTGGESVTVVADCPPAAVPASTEVNVETDVAYAGPVDESNGSDDTLQFDIAWPKDGGRHPLVVLLHGGGWEGGRSRTGSAAAGTGVNSDGAAPTSSIGIPMPAHGC